MANVYTIIKDRKKSDPDEYRDSRCRHLEEWRRQSEEARNKQLGQNHFSEAEELYQVRGPAGETPSFRPRVMVPELQKIILEDSNRISDISPRAYVFGSGKQSESREKALQALYQQARTNYHLLYSTITSRYDGVGFLQLCYSPDMRNGRGGLWVKSRDPRTVILDPTTDYEFDPSYIGWDDWMQPEEVRKLWPETSQRIRYTGARGTTTSLMISGTGYGFQMPQGPMSMMPGMPGQASVRTDTSSDTRVRVSHYFFKDYTRELVDKKDLPDGALTDPEFVWKYPNGRWIVECNGIILADGPNPFPKRRDLPAPVFPLFPVWAVPPLYGPWGVPITRFSQTLQALSEKLYTQLYENSIRLNNGVWFIDQATGINIESFGGMPGEVQLINSNSKPPECRTAPAMPAQAYSLPADLMKLQRMLQGQSDAKQGNPGSGNVSAGLFDAAVLQSSGMLQLAGRLQYFTIAQLCGAMFDTAGRYLDRFNLPLRGDKGTEIVGWDGIFDPHEFDLYLDEDSIQPLSEVALRRIVPELMKTGVMNTERGLQILGIPHAEKIAEEQRQTLELQALARTKGVRK